MNITLRPIATVSNTRKTPEDDHWGSVVSEIILAESFDEKAFSGIETFSHLEIIFYFDSLPQEKIENGSRHPRENPNWPLIGIFAQRAAGRPNRIGATIVELL